MQYLTSVDSASMLLSHLMKLKAYYDPSGALNNNITQYRNFMTAEEVYICSTCLVTDWDIRPYFNFLHATVLVLSKLKKYTQPHRNRNAPF